MRPTRKALFLDRDGVLNEEVGYLYRAADVRFLPGLVPLLQTARRLGYLLVVVTNQSGIARGLYTEADFHALMDFMRGELLRSGIELDAVYFAPYLEAHPERKPEPGMLLRAARELSLDLPRSLMIGDRCSDVAAANAAGLRQAFLLGGTEPGSCAGSYLSIAALDELTQWLVGDAATAAPPPGTATPDDPCR